MWKYFGCFTGEDGTPVKDKAVCRLCLSEVSYCKNTTTLHVHLERHHQSEYTLLLKADGEKDKLSEQSQLTLQKILDSSRKIKQDLVTRYQGDEIENVLHISMYLDTRFKALPTLTEQQKRAVLSAVKVELTTTILYEREKYQETEQIASPSESTVHSKTSSTQTYKVRKIFLMALLDQEQEKMVVLQKLLELNYKNMTLKNHSV